MTDFGPETLSTFRCPHGRVADDWCEPCELGGNPIYEALLVYRRALEDAWIEDGKIGAMEDLPSHRTLHRARGLFTKADAAWGMLIKVIERLP